MNEDCVCQSQTLSLISISLIGIILLTSNFVYVSASPSSSSCIAPPIGMIGWWPGDGNVNDIQGSSSSTIDGIGYCLQLKSRECI